VRYEQVEKIIGLSPRASEPERTVDSIERFQGRRQPTAVLQIMFLGGRIRHVCGMYGAVDIG
jgi:hypothetical protein